ncbi:MAG: flagellar biosynthesis protein FlhA [Pseudomonadota bacterium]
MRRLLALLEPHVNHAMGAPVFLLLLLAMMMLPLPAVALDLLFTFNIALSLVIILAVFYVRRPLELAIFPTILLLVTLLRLALNIASTRVVLLKGHEGTDAAGKVIEAFGEFVIGGNYTIGLVVFAILVIINFVVVTKGAGRVSEVTARFTLDAMPGRQMAIDADLNAGIIDQEQASARRAEIREEADFFGAMDGASKFVRGDAVAGILILLVNIIGGLAIGTLQHGLPLAEAVENYTLLTIGDGLVAQIPSLLLSTGTAVIVTRMSSDQDMGEQVINQLISEPRVLFVAGGVLFLLGLVPGMPNLVFLLLGGGGLAIAWQRRRRAQMSARAEQAAEPPPAPPTPSELSWDDVEAADLLGLEVGYRLIPLVDSEQDGPLVSKIRSIRRNLTQELGFLIPSVHIRDNLDLAPGAYRILLNGVPVATGEVHPGKELAIDPGGVAGQPSGIPTKDPTFGLDAVWVDTGNSEHARTLGYTVVDASTVVGTHLSQIIKTSAHRLLGHTQTQELLDRLTVNAPKALQEVVPAVMTLAQLNRVLQDLLKEGIPIRDMRSIVETLAEQAAYGTDPAALLAAVRRAIAPSIVHRINGLAKEMPAFTLAPQLEQILQDSMRGTRPAGLSAGLEGQIANAPALPHGDDQPGLDPQLADQLQQALANETQRREAAGEPAVLLVPPAIRAWLARFVRQGIPALNVLAYNEVPDDRRVRVVATVGG